MLHCFAAYSSWDIGICTKKITFFFSFLQNLAEAMLERRKSDLFLIIIGSLKSVSKRHPVV